MKKRVCAIMLGLLLPLLGISGCASINAIRIDGDPMKYLVGTWSGFINSPGDKLPEGRFLTIYGKAPNSMLYARYGIPGTTYQGDTMVKLILHDGTVNLNFRTGSGSTIDLQLMNFGDGKLVLMGTMRPTVVDVPPIRMTLYPQEKKPK